MGTRYVDPHLTFYVRATTSASSKEGPPEDATLQELRRSYDLGLYTIAGIEDLLEELGETLVSWIENHPPHMKENDGSE